MEIKKIGQNLKKIRKQKNLTTVKVGELLNCSHQVISNYECNQNQLNNETLFKLAKALECSVLDFFKDEEEECDRLTVQQDTQLNKLIEFNRILFKNENIEINKNDELKMVDTFKYILFDKCKY
ncbi:helix-turn-helix domain-containing protein [Streptobacillus moniliformis]|uniref:helix-turn-helix domain-containing protein n=1 Tax=Streptobacillus moniliformis TaxID=34105 RepID=UPI0007E3FBF5|nr:helix-turn-helix transcriptional regulator [Streptobacillus moniliformis]